jgi:hypothetical protein
MNSLLATTSQTATMTSLELVEYINTDRQSGAAQLAHSDFLKKVVQVLGELGAGNFSSTYLDVQNKERPCYKLPKREACLMAMSYSYELQAKVFDKMTAMEVQQEKKLPTSYLSALEALVSSEKARIEAVETKAQIGNRREATAMNTASQAVKHAEKLQIELDKSKQYASIKRMEMVYHGQEFKWRLLKDASIETGKPAIEIFDANYGTVKAYHADAWLAAYALSIQ